MNLNLNLNVQCVTPRHGAQTAPTRAARDVFSGTVTASRAIVSKAVRTDSWETLVISVSTFLFTLVLVLVWYVAGAKFGYRRDGRGCAQRKSVYVGGEKYTLCKTNSEYCRGQS